MPRLLIQCQGSPGPLSFEVTQSKADAVIAHYLTLHHRPVVIPLESDTDEWYYIKLGLVTWICVADEPEPIPGHKVS